MENTFDVIVIGGGPGGYVAAIKAAQLGLRTACVDKSPYLGGTCLNVGCIPSKALLNASEKFYELSHLKEFGIHVENATMDVPELMKKKDDILLSLGKGIEGLFKKNKVTHFKGTAQFVDARHVLVKTQEREVTLQGKSIIIATGSESSSMPGLPVDEKVILSSTGALNLKKAPKTLAVIGGGYIGLEMASVWQRLGSQVTIIEFQDTLIPMMDSDVRSGLLKALTAQGMTFLLGTKVMGADITKTGATLSLEKREGGEKLPPLGADAVLVSVGRKPFTEGLNLEILGIAKNEKGFIMVNDHFETNVPGIYAIGDVTPGPMLAHRSEEEGVAVAERLAGQDPSVDHSLIPGVVYTCPEAASVGKTEDDLKAAGTPYVTGKFPFAANSRAKANGATDGFVKILAHKATDQILGVHILGNDAGTLIGECVVAMAFKAASEDLARIIHAHPTTNEAIKEAALATFSKALHM